MYLDGIRIYAISMHISLDYAVEFNFICSYAVPNPDVQIMISEIEDSNASENETLTIGDPLTLDCTVTAVRGISSSVDIIWTTGGRVVRRVDNITADIGNDSAIYTDSFEIPSLSAIDNGRAYQCTVWINASPVALLSRDQITLMFPGEYMRIYRV